jgi:hypothetical protein
LRELITLLKKWRRQNDCWNKRYRQWNVQRNTEQPFVPQIKSLSARGKNKGAGIGLLLVKEKTGSVKGWEV